MEVFEKGEWESENNYGDYDDSVVCQFIAYAEGQPQSPDDLTCKDYEAEECMASIFSDPSKPTEPVDAKNGVTATNGQPTLPGAPVDAINGETATNGHGTTSTNGDHASSPNGEKTKEAISGAATTKALIAASCGVGWVSFLVFTDLL